MKYSIVLKGRKPIKHIKANRVTKSKGKYLFFKGDVYVGSVPVDKVLGAFVIK